MTKLNLIIVSLLLLTGCDEQLGDYYFDFDTIDYFNIKIDENKLLELEENPDITENQRLQIDVIIGNTPEKLDDTLFLENMGNIGFNKIEIPAEKYQDVNEIFKEKSHKESWATTCIAVYRDVIVFRKKGEIIGIAKICFDCRKHQILGTNANSIEFGQSGDYSKLAKILNEN